MMTPLDARKSGAREGGPSFSLGNRAFRVAWRVSWLLLASWTPPSLHAWRRLLLRLFGAQIARGARIYGSAAIWYPPNLDMGAFATVGPRANVYCMAKITIGPYAVISQDAELCAGSHDIDDLAFQLVAKPVTIGGKAWIAAGAFVGPGVSVGEGAVLGARGVAFKNLGSWEVYVGNPANFLRQRKAQSDV